MQSIHGIRENGIMLQQGRSYQDFTNDCRFYLNVNFSDASDWALKKAERFHIWKVAVLIYSFSRNSLTVSSCSMKEWNGEVLSNTTEVEWYIYRIPEDLVNKLTFSTSEKHYIIGNITVLKSRGEDFESWIPIPYNKSSQLCISVYEIAPDADRTLKTIIYLTPCS